MVRGEENMVGEPVVITKSDLRTRIRSCGVLVVAAGFEERALEIARTVVNGVAGKVLVVEYKADIKENDDALREVEDLIGKRGGDFIARVELDPYEPLSYSGNLRQCLAQLELGREADVWLDVSGLPQWAIAETLRQLRLRFPFNRIQVLYTAAAEYFPTEDEYLKSSVHEDAGVLQTNLPKSLTLEMADNLILDGFAGVSLKEYSSCLILFAGYEKHRSVGAIEQVNPSKLVLVYGRPGDPALGWRLDMSKRLHEALITERPTAEEDVSTLSVNDAIRLIERYYAYLYDDHNFSIAFVCSKMQTIGGFLAWERLRDVQLVFPQPVRYLPRRFSRGVGKSYSLELPPPPGLAGFGVLAAGGVSEGK